MTTTRRSRLLASLTRALLLACLAACASGPMFPGTIVITSEHPERVEFTVTGFESNPPFRTIGKGGTSGALMGEMPLPDTAYIRLGDPMTWNPQKPTGLRYAIAIPRPPASLGSDDHLELTRRADGCWFARWRAMPGSEVPREVARVSRGGVDAVLAMERTWKDRDKAWHVRQVLRLEPSGLADTASGAAVPSPDVAELVNAVNVKGAHKITLRWMSDEELHLEYATARAATLSRPSVEVAGRRIRVVLDAGIMDTTRWERGSPRERDTDLGSGPPACTPVAYTP